MKNYKSNGKKGRNRKSKEMIIFYTDRNLFFDYSAYWEIDGESIDIVIIDDYNKIEKMNSDEINKLLCPCPVGSAERLYVIVKSNDNKYYIAIPNLQIVSKDDEKEFFNKCEELGQRNPNHLKEQGNLIGYSENLGLMLSYYFEF